MTDHPQVKSGIDDDFGTRIGLALGFIFCGFGIYGVGNAVMWLYHLIF